MTDFDPYQQWLGIPAAFRPLNHYLLLGIPLYESRGDVIRAACDRQMQSVRQHQSGPRGAHCEKLLTELSQAKLLLLDEEKRDAYNTALKLAFDQNVEIGDDAANATTESVATTEARPANQQAATAAQPQTANSVGQPETEPSMHELSATPQAAEMPAGFYMHFNFRNAMVFAGVVLVVMLATILISSLRNDRPSPTGTAPEITSTGQLDSRANGTTDSASSTAEGLNPEPPWIGPVTQQTAKAEFLLRPADALTSGPTLKRTETGISGWSTKDDSCTWMIEVADRRTSFFYCEITYQSDAECRMQIQIGDQIARPFSIYPNDNSFTERFLVRLGAAKQQVRLSVIEIEATASVNVQQINLTPK